MERVDSRHPIVGGLHNAISHSIISLDSSQIAHGEALAHLERSLEVFREAYGADNEGPEMLAALCNYGTLLASLGRVEEAAAIQARLVAARKGDSVTVSTCIDRYNKACDMTDVGHIAEATELLTATLGEAEALGLAPSHELITSVAAALAGCLCRLSRLEEALPLFERAHTGILLAHGTNSVEVVSAQCSLASCLYKLGRRAEGEAGYTRAITICRAVSDSTTQSPSFSVVFLRAVSGNFNFFFFLLYFSPRTPFVLLLISDSNESILQRHRE